MKSSFSIFLQCMVVFIFPAITSAAQPTNDLLFYLQSNSKDPEEYVLEKFKTHDVVLLGEDHGVRQNLLFVQSLIPALYATHVYNIGMEFGASEDQQLLDSLITAPVYSEDVARKIMFHYNVARAFQEYRDIYKKAWEFNRALPAKAKKIQDH